MFKKLFVICFVVLAVLSCKTVPVTGRQQLILIPSSEMMAMSYSQYSQFLNENKVLRGTKDAIMIQQMGQRIQKSVEVYMAERGLSNQLRGFEWEFNLVDDPTVNAWCMPGGKVVFYTGILPVTQNENATAIVMGHEIAHAVANHGAERMSQGLLAQGVNVAVNVATMEKSPMLQQLFNTSFGVGSTLGILAFSRKHESEADEMGLFFAAMAGYDPREAPAFWQRMSQLSGGGAPPEFMSTHPSHDRRINDLNALMPKAMEYYEQSQRR
jgi:predicted Zn-dependent protease